MIQASGQFHQLAPVENKVPGDGLAGTAQAIIGTLYAHIQRNSAILYFSGLDHHSVTQGYCCNVVGISILAEHSGQLDEMSAAPALCAQEDQGILKPIRVYVTIKNRALKTGGVALWRFLRGGWAAVIDTIRQLKFPQSGER
jgi:hypothetical protein